MYMNDMANLILILSCIHVHVGIYVILGLFVITCTCTFLLATGERGCVLQFGMRTT